MIPVKLTIEGLYSYQKKQSIDFKKLSDNHLFGIFGNVGSGKSSILEAIIFALYGKTDRLLKSGDNRNYNMMNLKSDRLFIEFDFITGKDQKEFKVVIEGKRNSKKFDDVKTFTRTAYIKVNDDFSPISTDDLENHIGLSYENFKRTVIIPQGKFQEFLQLSNAERTKMMKELFNLEKYELYNKTKRIEERNNEQINKLKGSLDQLGDISEDQLNELKENLKKYEEEFTSLNTNLEKQNIVLKELDKLKDLTQQLLNFSEKKNQLEEKASSIKVLEKSIAEFEYCAIYFKSLCDAIDRHKSKIKELTQTTDTDSKKLGLQQKDFNEKQEVYVKIQSEYENLDTKKKELDDINKLKDVKSATERFTINQSRKQKGEVTINQVIESVTKYESLEKEISDKIVKLKTSLPNIEELSKAQQWHSENDNQTKLLNDVKIDIEKVSKSITDINNQINLIGNNIDILNNIAIQEWNNIISEKLKSNESELSKINLEIEESLQLSGLDSYAKKLTDGAPCPLCGSTHHPSPFSNNEFSEKINALKKIKINKESEIKELLQTQQLVAQKLATLNPFKEQLKTLELKKKNIFDQIQEHQKLINPKYKDNEVVKESFNKIKELTSTIETTEKELTKTREEHQTALKNKERYQIELQKIQSEIDKEQHTIELLSAQVSKTLSEKYSNFTIEQLDSEFVKQQTYINDISTQHSALQKQLEEVKKQIDQLEGSLNTNKKFLESEEKELSSQNSILSKKIQNSEFKDTVTIKNILAKEYDIEKEKAVISEFHKENQTVHSKIKELEDSIQGKKYIPEEHAACNEIIKQISQQINVNNQLQGETKNKIEDINKRLAKQKDLAKELQNLNERADNIKLMKRMFHGSGFVNYISSVYLQNLCLAANERFFKMTRQKLSLELSNDNNFEVRDFLNGGKLRSVKTLSGGQTFQAALSLALALADNVQNLTQTDQNFFFLDEGFGSLDKEALEIVFNTLKGLKKENRIVGIISHVEELQQEIPLFLKITQDEDNGSFIEESF